jgi:glycine cleavage system H protein
LVIFRYLPIFARKPSQPMTFPADLRYTADHEWIRLDADGTTATIGITDFAQHELGDIVYVDISTVGQTVAKGEIFGSVEAVKTVSDLFLPVEGTVTEVNKAVEKSPELVNNDPYGEGWIIKLTVADPASLAELMTDEAYKTSIGQ